MAAQKKVYDWILYSLLLALFSFYALRGFFYLTDGFSTSSILLPGSFDAFTSIGLKAGEKERLLSQPFHYLGKGIQSYVFLSEDGTFVIKFIKAKHFKTEDKRALLENIFKSWEIAFNKLQDTTGVFYLHFPKEGEPPFSLTLVDKLGFSYRVEGDKLVFLLQKRAEPLLHYLERKMEAGDRASAEKILSRLLERIVEENRMGIRDLDPTLLQNTGVVDDRPVHIDVSDFVEEKLPEAAFSQDLFNRTYRLRVFLAERYPALEQKFTKQLEAILGKPVKDFRPTIKIIEEGD